MSVFISVLFEAILIIKSLESSLRMRSQNLHQYLEKTYHVSLEQPGDDSEVRRTIAFTPDTTEQ